MARAAARAGHLRIGGLILPPLAWLAGGWLAVAFGRGRVFRRVAGVRVGLTCAAGRPVAAGSSIRAGGGLQRRFRAGGTQPDPATGRTARLAGITRQEPEAAGCHRSFVEAGTAAPLASGTGLALRTPPDPAGGDAGPGRHF